MARGVRGAIWPTEKQLGPWALSHRANSTLSAQAQVRGREDRGDRPPEQPVQAPGSGGRAPSGIPDVSILLLARPWAQRPPPCVWRSHPQGSRCHGKVAASRFLTMCPRTFGFQREAENLEISMLATHSKFNKTTPGGAGPCQLSGTGRHGPWVGVPRPSASTEAAEPRRSSLREWVSERRLQF